MKKDADISLIENPEINDRLIIHAGFAIEKFSSEDTDNIEKTWSDLSEFLERQQKHIII